MGTGVGEAMLIGAAVGATAGGAGAAIQGGDPLKGALLGAGTGAIGGGIAGYAGAAPAAIEGGATGAGTGAATGAGTGAGAGTAVTPTASALAGSAPGSTFGSLSTAPTSSFGTLSAASNTGAGISGVGAGSGTLGSAGFGAGTGVAGYTPGMYSSGAAAMPGGASAAPATNIFGQTAGTPGYLSNTQLGLTAGTAGLAGAMQAERSQYGTPPTDEYDGPLSKLKYDPNKFTASEPQYAPGSVYRPSYAASGGLMGYAGGGNFDDESGIDEPRYMASGGIARYGLGGIADPGVGAASNAFSSQGGGTPASLAPQGLEALMGVKKKGKSVQEMIESAKLQGLTPRAYLDIYGQGIKAEQNMASGGISSLGGYSDGGRMLKGPGDGMSDSIPGVIGGKQPARLADGEFVVPADVVSHLGNGSTDAGAKQLYAMMDKVRKARTGNKKQGKQINPRKYMPA